jgi:hypothetical protein
MTIDSVCIPYDHPVLWSLRRKRVEERKVAAENLRLQQQLRERLRLRQLQENNEVNFTTKLFYNLTWDYTPIVAVSAAQPR